MDKRPDAKLRQAFTFQKYEAKRRGIKFLLTYDTWLEIWQASNHLHERGRKRDQYVMARRGDRGPYDKQNVRIISVTDNHREVPSKIRSRNAAGNKGFSGRRHTEETKQKMRMSKRRK